jgi:hypothetical protein
MCLHHKDRNQITKIKKKEPFPSKNISSTAALIHTHLFISNIIVIKKNQLVANGRQKKLYIPLRRKRRSVAPRQYKIKTNFYFVLLPACATFAPFWYRVIRQIKYKSYIFSAITWIF